MERKRFMIFYFTGTGNSLYIAKQIEKDPVSIPRIIHNENQTYAADSIGIVAPIYGHEVPHMVREFLQKATFKTDYFYMLLTYGNRHGGAAELAQKLCREYGVSVNYINVILMVDNWLPSFDMNEQKAIDKRIPEQLAPILADLGAKKNAVSPVTDTDRAAHRQFLERMAKQPADAWQQLIRVTDACVGCGICESVCPSASIRMKNGRAEYTPGKCQTCLACAHACPRKAILLTVPEKNPNARYCNEHISLQEIISANRQNDFFN